MIDYYCRRCKDTQVWKSCACGECNKIISYRDYQARIKIYSKGHNQRGSKSTNWKGGRTKDKYGYWLIKDWNHPNCSANGYIREHRLIYEQYHNVCLLPWIHIDHINQQRDDNRIENLRAMSSSDHMRRHMITDMSNRKCSKCGTTKTYISKRNNRPEWLKDGQGGYLCRSCSRRKPNVTK